MKKFLVILMVVAVASFLFTGCIPTVPVAVTGVTLDQATMPLTAGGATGTLVATVAPADATDKSVNWSSSAPAVATVANGVVTPLTAGTTTITVTTVDGSLTATCAVTVATGELPTTVAPIIIAQDAGALVNKAEAANGIIVNGTGRTYAEIKLSIDGVLVSSGDVEVDGTWIVVIAKADLGADGAKVLTATATEPGLAESLKSNEVKFTLDTVLPTIDKCSAKAGTPAALDSAVEVSDTSEALLFPPYIPDGIFGIPWFPWLGEYWVVDPTLLVEGTWTLVVKSILDVPPIGLSLFDIITVEATDPTGVKTPFTFSYDGGGAIYQFISGVSCVFEAFSTNDVGHMATVKVTVASAAVPGYIDVTFDEAVTGASILVPPAGTGVWTAFGATVNLAPIVTVRSSTTARLTENNPIGFPNLVAGVAFSVSCSGITDLAGNIIITPDTCTGVVLP